MVLGCAIHNWCAMTFVFDLPHDDSMSIAATWRTNPDEREARVPIGHDPDLNLQYNLIVSLYTLNEAEFGEGAAEITFEIVAIGEGDPIYFMDGSETKAFLRVQRQRDQVLSLTAFLAQQLLEHRKPQSVHMSTKSRHTPDKALRKYASLTKAILELGYVGGRADTFDGIDIWMFRRD